MRNQSDDFTVQNARRAVGNEVTIHRVVREKIEDSMALVKELLVADRVNGTKWG